MNTITLQEVHANYGENAIALALHLDLPEYPEDHTFQEESESLEEYISSLDEAQKLIDDGDYLSLTDEESDDAEDKALENYIDECILSELPEQYKMYFDNEAWKSDARMDGRGNSLATYDGHEHEQSFNGTTYYIYRCN